MKCTICSQELHLFLYRFLFYDELSYVDIEKKFQNKEVRSFYQEVKKSEGGLTDII